MSQIVDTNAMASLDSALRNRFAFRLLWFSAAALTAIIIGNSSARAHWNSPAGFCNRFYDRMFQCEGGEGIKRWSDHFCEKARQSPEAAKQALLRNANEAERPGIEADRGKAIERTIALCQEGKSFEERRASACGQMQTYCTGPNAKGRQNEKKDCGGPAECMRKALAEQSKGKKSIGQEKANLQSTITEMDKALADALAQALNYLEGAEQNMNSEGSTGASQLGALKHDHQLVAQAIQNSDSGKKFELDDAENAKLSGTREILSVAALAKGFRDYAKEGLEDVIHTEGVLDKMMANTSNHTTELGSIGESTISGTGKATLGVNANSKKLSSPFKNGLLEAGNGESTITSGAEKIMASGDTEKLDSSTRISGGANGSPAGGAGSIGAASANDTAGSAQEKRTPSLRELLAKRMRNQANGNQNEDGSEKTEGLGGKAADPEILANGSFERKLFESKGKAGTGEGGVPSNFAMKGSEDDTAISKMVASWDIGRRPASSPDLEDGLLSIDSISLFERVHQAHHACIQRKCL